VKVCCLGWLLAAELMPSVSKLYLERMARYTGLLRG